LKVRGRPAVCLEVPDDAHKLGNPVAMRRVKGQDIMAGTQSPVTLEIASVGHRQRAAKAAEAHVRNWRYRFLVAEDLTGSMRSMSWSFNPK
jgi:hypothetical protein